MEPEGVNQVKKHKIRWIPFFACAIIFASAVNILNTFAMLINLSTPEGRGKFTSEAIGAFGLNLAGSSTLIALSLVVFILRMPMAVRLWERKEWGRKLTLWLTGLSVLMVPGSLVLMNTLGDFGPSRKALVLAEGIVFNVLVIWYFSRSKIKSVFVK